MHRKHGSFRLIAAFAIQIKNCYASCVHIVPFNPWNPFKEIASLSFTQGLNHDPIGSPADQTTPFMVLYFILKFQQQFSQVGILYCQIRAKRALP